MGKNSTITMADLMKKVNEGTATTRACQQVTSEQIADLGKAQQSGYDNIMQRIDEHEDNMSKATYHVCETVTQSAGRTIREVRESECRLSKKIDSIGTAALGALDWITIIIVTILGGVGGWFFSKCMISHQFAAWVDRTDTVNYVRDAAGNIVDITNTTTATTVWPTVILTVLLFAVVGLTVSYAICSSIREREVD